MIVGEHEEKLTNKGADLRLHAQVESPLSDKFGKRTFLRSRLLGDAVYAVILFGPLIGMEDLILCRVVQT